jgi:hypothetical protein
MKRITILSLLLLIASVSYSQRYLLYENVEREWDERNTNYGPNKKHYIYPYMKGGQILGVSSDSLPVNYWGSGNIGLGLRYKHKLTSWWSHGLDISYNYQSFNIAQKDEKVFIDSDKHKKERLNIHQIAGNYFWRFRLGRAGNTLGKYFDIGGYGAWNFSKNHVIKENENLSNSKKQKVKLKNVDYLEDIEYGVIARIGFPRVALFGQYRLSDMLKNVPENSDKLPAITVGVEINLNR